MIDSYVVVDVETTGLDPKKDRLLEIGALKILEGRPAGTFSKLINPRCEIPEKVKNLTGITNRMASMGHPVSQTVLEFIEFAGNLPLAGHHVIFDYSFLKRAAVNAGAVFEKEGLDTLKISRQLLPELPSRSLEALCAHYEIYMEHHHRALDDAVATAELLHRLVELETSENKAIFQPKPLLYRIKKEKSMTKHQKKYLIDLLKYHRIKLGIEIDSLTRNEASRITDEILSEYGKARR